MFVTTKRWMQCKAKSINQTRAETETGWKLIKTNNKGKYTVADGATAVYDCRLCENGDRFIIDSEIYLTVNTVHEMEFLV